MVARDGAESVSRAGRRSEGTVSIHVVIMVKRIQDDRWHISPPCIIQGGTLPEPSVTCYCDMDVVDTEYANRSARPVQMVPGCTAQPHTKRSVPDYSSLKSVSSYYFLGDSCVAYSSCTRHVVMDVGRSLFRPDESEKYKSVKKFMIINLPVIRGKNIP